MPELQGDYLKSVSARHPFIVLAAPRSATSAVARILHTQCGVCMGHRLRRPNANNPDGYYEDLEIQRLHVLITPWVQCGVLMRRITPTQYRKRLLALADDRAQCGAWGFKDPTACEVLQHLVEVMPHATYIRCKRPYADVLASWLRIYNTTEGSAAAAIKRADANLDRYLPDAHVITTDELQTSEAAVVKRLRGIVSKSLQHRGIGGTMRPAG